MHALDSVTVNFTTKGDGVPEWRHQHGRRQSGWRKRYRREISLSRPATSPGMRVSPALRDARCLGLHLRRRRHADKFAGLEGRRSPNHKPICCWGSAWSSPWPPRACARWRAADPMRKPPGEKCEAALELLREPRLLAQPSTAFQVIPPVYRTNLQGALRVDLTHSPRCWCMTAICAFETWGDVSCRRLATIGDRGDRRRSRGGRVVRMHLDDARHNCPFPIIVATRPQPLIAQST